MLVISHACFTAINRSVYHLFVKDGWKAEIVVPKTLKFPSGLREADAPKLNDPPIHYLELVGENPRIYYFEGLRELLDQKKPRIIVLDCDPVSMLAWQVGSWAKNKHAWLFCISNENLPLDMRAAYDRKGIKGIPAAIIKRGMMLRTRKLVDGIFAINRDGEQLFIKEGFSNVMHMPLGYDPAYFYPDESIRSFIRKKCDLTKTVIAYFGRLTPEKGIHVLIRALEGMKEYDWQLVMDSFSEFASGYHQEISRLIESSGIRDRVVYVSPSHTEIASYMNAVDIIVVPSVTAPDWKEQYGRVAAEGMACGRLVVASESGALPEVLNGHGYLFEEGNADTLRKILVSLVKGGTNAPATSNETAAYALESLSIHRQKQIMQAAFE